MSYILGVDQGGSKTVAILGDENGNILGMGKSRGANHADCGLPDAVAAVKEAVLPALAQGGLSIGDVSVLAAGMTGVDWEDEPRIIRDALAGAFPDQDIQVVNDCIIAMRAETNSSYCCILCAGSGLNCAVRKDGRTQFVYGYYIGDEYQGGSSLGRAAVNAVIESSIGLRGDTALTGKMLRYFGLPSVQALLRNKVEGKIHPLDYLRLPVLLEEAAAENDAPALEILADYGKDIARYVICGMEKLSMLSMDTEVILSGSIFKCRIPVLREAVSLEIHKRAVNARVMDAVYEPVVGALLLGLDMLGGRATERAAQNIRESAERFDILRIHKQEGVLL